MVRGSCSNNYGFALPTVLITTVILFMLLVTGLSATVAVNDGLRDAHHTELAQLAADAGNAFALACLGQSGGQLTWGDATPLRPNTDCTGAINTGDSAYVLDQGPIRTYFVVDAGMQARGYTEAVRSATNAAWRVWTSSTASAVAVPISSNNPIGTLIEGVWSSAPSGYLLADGSAVSRTQYSALFAVIGVTYGSGNGSTTFNLPDSRGRVLVQQSASDSEYDTVGERGGAKTHVLTGHEMPSHTHTQNGHSHGFSDPGHSHSEQPHSHSTYSNNSSAELGGQGLTNASNFQNRVLIDQFPGGKPTSSIASTINTAWTGASVQSSTATNQNAGGNGAHNNLQPYFAISRAIKY